MADFEKEFYSIIKVEGGFVNDPADKGGATKFGITIKTLSDYLGRNATVEDVKNLDIGTAKIIFKKKYWDVCLLDQIKSQVIAHFIFDQIVNSGPGIAIMLTQAVIGSTQDGIMGQRTIALLNVTPEKRFLKSFFKKVQQRYVQICVKDASQIRFLAGWLEKRANPMLDFI